MLLAAYNEKISEDNTEDIYQKDVESNHFEYTFYKNKDKENKEKVQKFDDPYMYKESAPTAPKQPQTETVISQLRDYLLQNKNSQSARQ
mmetsp:Transcript_7960/g.7045  ORF Transcript_7960/g.7045 Transcript_7960/m.7045 type:complete len:89 (-) Transcript_7960:509-775(-)